MKTDLATACFLLVICLFSILGQALYFIEEEKVGSIVLLALAGYGVLINSRRIFEMLLKRS